MLKYYRFGFISFIFLLSSCSTMVIDIDYDDSLTFNGLKNFAWVPDTPQKTNNPKVDSNTLLQDRIHGEITRWLLTHGYTNNENEKPDFLVAYQLIVEDKTKMTVVNDYYSYPMGWGYGYHYPYGYRNRPRQYIYEYQQGALVIDIVNPETRKLMWRGSATDEVTKTNTPEKRQAMINEAVDKVLQEFPPKRK